MKSTERVGFLKFNFRLS